MRLDSSFHHVFTKTVDKDETNATNSILEVQVNTFRLMGVVLVTWLCGRGTRILFTLKSINLMPRFKNKIQLSFYNAKHEKKLWGLVLRMK